MPLVAANNIGQKGAHIPIYKEGEILVKLKEKSNISKSGQELRIKRVATRIEAKSRKKLHHRSVSLLKNSDKTTAEMISILENDPSVEFVQPNYIYSKSVQTKPWGIGNNNNLGTNADLVHSTYSTTGQSIIVAVLDTGVNYNHPDLINNIYLNSSEIAGNNIDDDNNGYIDDYYGYDFAGSYNDLTGIYSEDSDPEDFDGHGSHVAGTIAAIDNSEGVIGVAPDAKIMAVKVLDDLGYGTSETVANGIDYARINGAHVINMSLGSTASASIEENAINEAVNAGVTVVSAAGNGGEDYIGDPALDYPAAYNNVIAVGAVDPNLEYANFSNYSVNLDVVAPGVGVESTVPYGDYYDIYSGTSMSTPHVSGIVALLKSKDFSFTPAQIQTALRNNAKSLTDIECTTKCGQGFADAKILFDSLYREIETGDVIINEVAWSGSSLSTADEWIELKNTTDIDIDLSGWQLTTNTGTEELMLTIPSGTIPANGYFLISNYDATHTSSVLDIAPDLTSTSVNLSNTALQIKLYRDNFTNNNLIDTAGDGSTPLAGDNMNPKATMSRIDYATDGTKTNDWYTSDLQGTNYDVSSNEAGTPGEENITPLNNGIFVITLKSIPETALAITEENVQIARIGISTDSEDSILIENITLQSNGSIDHTDISNIYAEIDGNTVSNITSIDNNNNVILDFSNNIDNGYIISESSDVEILIKANIDNGIGESVYLEINNIHSDITATSIHTGIPADRYEGFHGDIYGREIYIIGGDISFSLNSTSKDVYPGTDSVEFGVLNIENINEGIEIDNLNINVNTINDDACQHIDNLKLIDTKDDSVIAGPYEISCFNGSSTISIESEFSIEPGATKMISMQADILSAKENASYTLEIEMDSMDILGLTTGELQTGTTGYYDIRPAADISTAPIFIASNTLIIEDGDDVSDWIIYDNKPSGAQVNSIDGEVVFTGTSTLNGVRTGDINNSNHLVAGWKMKTTQNYYIIFRIGTNKGKRFLVYTQDNKNKGKNGKIITYGLGSHTKNNQYHEITRDLTKDLRVFESDAVIQRVERFAVRGSQLYLDDIKLYSVPEGITIENAEDGLTEGWQIKTRQIKNPNAAIVNESITNQIENGNNVIRIAGEFDSDTNNTENTLKSASSLVYGIFSGQYGSLNETAREEIEWDWRWNGNINNLSKNVFRFEVTLLVKKGDITTVRRIIYRPVDGVVSFDGATRCMIGLGGSENWSTTDLTTQSRSLRSDLDTACQGNVSYGDDLEILEILNFKVYGVGDIDNIVLK